MPNLVGVYDPSAGRASLERDLAKMVEAVDLPAFEYRRKLFIDRRFACANLLTGVERNTSQPVFGPAGEALLLDGELWNVDELRTELSRSGVDSTESMDDARLALALIQTIGARAFERMAGMFNVLYFEPRTAELTLVSDRLGSRILFYAEDGARFTFASEAKAVIAGRKVRTTPGGPGLFHLLLGGTQVGDETWLEGIRVLPPGTIMKRSLERAFSRRYWRFRFAENGPEMSEAAYAEEFASRLQVATVRALKDQDRLPIAITLSGGLDSRAVALSIPKSRLPIPALTYGDPDSADVVYARQLAEVIGLDHDYIERERERLVSASTATMRMLSDQNSHDAPGFYSSQLDRIVWRNEAMSAFFGSASVLWHPIYRPRMRVMLNGAAGDALTGSHLGPRLLLEPTRAATIQALYRSTWSQDETLLRQILNPKYYAQHAGDAEQTFARLFDDIHADEAMALHSVWDMENRQRRGSFATFAIERYFCSCRPPFLDYDLFEFLARIPGRWRFQQRIYKRMLVKHFPEARHVPWACTRGRITASPGYEFVREAKNYLVNRLRERAMRGHQADERWAFRDAASLLRADRALFSIVERFVSSDRFPSDVFSASGVDDFLKDFRDNGGSGAAVLFAHLVGIARAIEFFLDRPIQVPRTADPSEFGVSTLPAASPH